MSAKQSRRTLTSVAQQKLAQFDPLEHNALIKAIIDEFAPHFAPGSVLAFARDIPGRPSHFDENRLAQLKNGGQALHFAMCNETKMSIVRPDPALPSGSLKVNVNLNESNRYHAWF